MINRYTLLLSLLVIGCSKDYIEEEVYLSNSTPTLEVQTVAPTAVVPETITYSTLSERYSSINETTGYFKSQEEFTEYLSKDFIDDNLTVHINGDHAFYKTFHKNIALLDIDGDSKLDILAFANSFCSEHSHSSHQGKLIFISNFKEHISKQVFDIDAYFGAGKMEINDFNTDGISDVIFFTHDTKGNVYIEEEEYGGDTNFEPNRPHLITFNGDLQISKIGIVGDSHTATSGDIDNDGDIDFIQFPIPSVYNNNHVWYPPTLNRNESGYFISEDLVIDLGSTQWYTTAIDLFDLNADGNLDLITGWRIGPGKFPVYDNDLTNSLQGPLVLWGNGTGSFSMSNSSELSENFLSSRNVQATILGFGFTDFDTDGDIDIIVSSTRDEPDGNFEDGTYYDNYYLLLYENNNNSFYDHTQYINDSFDQSSPNFYSIRTVDINNDGLIDIVPDQFANWGNKVYVNNLYWKNTGNNYEKSW